MFLRNLKISLLSFFTVYLLLPYNFSFRLFIPSSFFFLLFFASFYVAFRFLFFNTFFSVCMCYFNVFCITSFETFKFKSIFFRRDLSNYAIFTHFPIFFNTSPSISYHFLTILVVVIFASVYLFGFI